MAAALRARGLRKRYAKLQAVDGVDIQINPGECVALLGPNGAGKTTTVEMLEGLSSPDEGHIELFGMELKSHYRQVMERVGVLLQETKLYKKLTIRETLELFASFFSRSTSLKDLIALVDLEEKTNARLEQLSGGQRQRAYLACALVNDPELVFLDEPTTGLDPQARRLIWDLIKSLKKDNRAFLLTTHYMDEAEYLADRVMVIDHGKIIAEGSPQSLIETHCGGDLLKISLLKESASLWPTLHLRCPWLKDPLATEENHFQFRLSNTAKQVQELSLALAALNIGLESMELRRATLEDVFLTLTGRKIRDA